MALSIGHLPAHASLAIDGPMKYAIAYCIILLASTAQAEPARWQPTAIASFDIQLNTPESVADIPAVDMVELDHDSPAGLLQAVKARGTRMVCYINAGAWESYRQDRAQFPAHVLGNVYDGFPDERWLDIRNIKALAPIMLARMDQCKRAGFDAIDPDNVNGYENDTGFDLSRHDQLAYNRWLLQQAHARGLAIALKNTPELAAQLEKDGYDFAVTESCFADAFCEDFQPFLNAKKPVFDLEYQDEGMTLSKFCTMARLLGINAVLKHSSSSVDTMRYSCD